MAITPLKEPTNAYWPGNCTWYVASRFPNIAMHLGNAINWIPNARKQGYRILAKPAPDTVVVYGTKYSPMGHVAVVDRVNSDGTFVVSEMNYVGLNVTSQRTSTMNGVLGFIVPPGSTYKNPSATLAAKITGASSGGCVTSSITIPGIKVLGVGSADTVICMDGVMGVSAMVAGGLIMLLGMAVLVAFGLKGTAAGQAAAGIAGTFGGPAGKVAAVAATNKAKPAPSGPSPEAASNARVATARSRVRSPEAESAVSEAKAGRGKRLSPNVSKELSEEK